MEEETTFDKDKCVICFQKFDDDNPHIQLSEKGISSLISHSKLRNHRMLKKHLKRCVRNKVGVLVHKICRRDFTDIKRPFTIVNCSAQVPSKKLRSSMDPFAWKENCFLCSKTASKDGKNPGRNNVHSVTFIELRRKLIEQCNSRNDDWGNNVYTRLSCSNDLVADEGIYHKTCLSRFLLNWPSPYAANSDKGRPVDENMLQWFNMLCLWLEVEAEAELYTLTELHDKMTELASGEDVYCKKSLKKKLKDKYKASIYFAEIDGRSNVVCFTNMIDYIINDAWYNARNKNKYEDAERIVATAAKLIMEEIREKKYNTKFYPKADDIANDQQEWVPKSLKTFLEILIRPVVKQRSIGQSIVYAARPRSVIPPIPFGLGVELDHIFGSKWLLDEMSHLGFSVSYQEVTRFKQSVMMCEDTLINNDMPPNTFTQYVADNVDHNICTLDGKQTFHGMGIIQASTNRNGIQRNSAEIKRYALQRVNQVTRNMGIPIEQYIDTGKSMLSTMTFKPLPLYIHFPSMFELDIKIDLMWQTSYFFSDTKQPNWSGFMQTYRNGDYPGKSDVNLLPIINLNPSDKTCIYSTLLYVIELCKKSSCVTPCITFDQPLWLKSIEIISEKSLKIVCRLGGFHTMMSFLGSIGTVMKGSGLSECLQTIYGENAVTHIETGKAIARAIRGHLLCQRVLNLKTMKTLFSQPHGVSEEDAKDVRLLYESYVSGKVNDEDVSKSDVLVRISQKIESEMGTISTKSRTAKLWVQYIKYVDVLKRFIAAERTGNWSGHLVAVTKMFNLFAATGHIHYAKCSRLYVQMMLDLPKTFPDLHEKFLNEGYHVVRRSDRYWGGLWTDLTIEQVMMRSLKTRGGLTRGRGMTENVILTWIHTMHICAQVHNSMTELTKNQHKTSNQHIELGASRIKRDNDDLEKMLTWLDTNDPFDENEPSLKSIASGLTAGEKDNINCDEAEIVGKKIQDLLDGVPFADATIRRKDQVKTLVSLKTGIQIENEIVYVDPMLLFSRLLALIEREEEMKKYFRYELTSTPTSLFENGMMRKSNKSSLATALKKDVIPLSIVTFPYYVLDGGALLHKVKWIPNSTYQGIINLYTRYVMNKYGTCCIVFDGYDKGPYIKDHEHKRRKGKTSADINFSLQNETTCSQDIFLKNSKNKSRFISLLSTALRQDNHDVRNSEGDADTQIVFAALEYASNFQQKVVVVASDTDVLILLMFHLKDGMQIFMLSEAGKKQDNSKKTWDISTLVNSAGELITRNILFIHAWSGCDTTSAAFGRGKTSIIKKFKESNVCDEIAEVFLDETATQEEIKNAGVKMFTKSYNGREDQSLEELRYRQFMQMAATARTSIKPQNLPPTENAAYYHCLRVHLQVIEWKTMMSTRLTPTDWGWKIVQGCFEPIMTDLEPAPPNILKFIRCKCNVASKNTCGSNICTCRKNGLKCVAACGSCNGVNCENSNNEINQDDDDDEDEDDYRNIFEQLDEF